MTLPAFAAFAGAIAAVFVFAAITILEQSYRVLVEGMAWHELTAPVEVIGGLLVMAILCGAGASFVLARSFQRVLQKFLAYLDDTTSCARAAWNRSCSRNCAACAWP